MRRNLNFEHLDAAVNECRSLLSTGYMKTGEWSLGQICCHMRRTIEANMNGYPNWMTILGYPLRPILRRLALPKLLAGKSPKGIKTAGMFVPPADLNDAEEVEAFAKCVEQFLASNNPLHPHPGFEEMDRDGFNHFHAAHSAHHLSFLIPNEN